MSSTEAEKRTLEPGSKEEPEAAVKKLKTEKDSEESVEQVVKKITEELKEENESLVRMMVKQTGCKAAEEMLEETKKIEEGEGIKTADGARRKTAGGVFLHLCRDKIGRSTFNALCQENHKMQKREKQSQSDKDKAKQSKKEESSEKKAENHPESNEEEKQADGN